MAPLLSRALEAHIPRDGRVDICSCNICASCMREGRYTVPRWWMRPVHVS